MVARRLIVYRHVLVAAPQLLERLGEPLSPEELHHMPCAAWCGDANTLPVWRLGDHVVEPKAILTINDYLQLRSRVLAGSIYA